MLTLRRVKCNATLRTNVLGAGVLLGEVTLQRRRMVVMKAACGGVKVKRSSILSSNNGGNINVAA